MTTACPACSADVPEGARSCLQCGGDLEGVRDFADRLEAEVTPTGEYADFVAGFVAPALVEADEVDRLGRLVSAARPVAPWGRARLAQAEAVLAAVRGDHDGAVELAKESIELCESLGHLFDPTRSRLIAARSLLALGRREEALELCTRAQADAEAMGALLLAEESRALAEEGGGWAVLA